MTRPGSGADSLSFAGHYDSLRAGTANKQHDNSKAGQAGPPPAAAMVNGHVKVVEEPAPLARSSMLASIINTTKGMLGSGILTMPLALHEASVLPGLVLMIAAAACSGFSFALLGLCAEATGADSFHGLWAATVGKRAWMVQVAITVDSFLSLWAYTTLVADFVVKTSISLLPDWPLLHSRFIVLGLVGAFLLAPLSFQQTLDALKYTSALGLAAIAYSCACVFTEYVERGEGMMHLSENFCAVKFLAFKSSVLFSFSFGYHYSVPKMYFELEQRSEGRIAWVATASFCAAVFIYGAFGLLGYGSFGAGVAGNVLLNFEEGSSVLLMMWIAMAATMIFGYPMLFMAFKENVFGMLQVDERNASISLRLGVVCLGVAGTCWLGACVEDASLVMGLCGSMVSSAVQFGFPGLIFLCLERGTTNGRKQWQSSSCLRVLSKGLLVVGAVTFVTGLAATLSDALGKSA